MNGLIGTSLFYSSLQKVIFKTKKMEFFAYFTPFLITYLKA